MPANEVFTYYIILLLCHWSATSDFKIVIENEKFIVRMHIHYS